ncbi:double-stranded DNA-binding domain-containing protein [Sphaerosporella brunnea]|uniref:Double-stranded DNA-binding domain-containing protein n=1 Tax=Sphaerosporella brunnea TaxID=1250544 RepID=A0A5J5FBM7_9PEZI|nr:double-stranded DNA-binding domain-containing protein [Sphaerosporella brunnea]
MEDDELAKIRAARMADLQQRGAGGSSGGAGEKQSQEVEARKQILSQICSPEAVDRLGRIAMVKAERATDLENRLIMLARSGQIRGRVSDDDLIKLIRMVDESDKKQGGGNGGEGEIVFQRRKGGFDDDDDDFF